MNSKAKLLFGLFLSLATVGRAVSFGAALSVSGNQGRQQQPVAGRVPAPVSFREVPGRGLIVRTWINSVGPYDFAIDTGAGATLLSQRVADEARVTTRGGRTSIAGLSGVSTAARSASIQTLAIGDRDNYLPDKGEAMIVTGLRRDLDG